MKTCNIDGCEKTVNARGWCSMHYLRWRKHGDPFVGGSTYGGPEEAFEARTEPLVGDPGCVVWMGPTDSSGYGRVWVNGRNVRAHRYAWERANGPIPDGMIIDHVCHERSCVNTDHLRLATPAENSWNRAGAHLGRTHDLPRGVYRHPAGYQASVWRSGKRHHLGTFSTPEEASAAAQTKRALLFGEYAGGA